LKEILIHILECVWYPEKYVKEVLRKVTKSCQWMRSFDTGKATQNFIQTILVRVELSDDILSTNNMESSTTQHNMTSANKTRIK
jgi:hypothetical protein